MRFSEDVTMVSMRHQLIDITTVHLLQKKMNESGEIAADFFDHLYFSIFNNSILTKAMSIKDI